MADNFLVAGFREVERKFSRFSLRQKMGQQSTERTGALAALGQRAWEERVDLSAFAELRDRLTALDTRAGEISQTAGKLESGKSALEQERRSTLDAFAARRREVEEKKNPVDAALRTGRARRTECAQAIAQEDAIVGCPKRPGQSTQSSGKRYSLPLRIHESLHEGSVTQMYHTVARNAVLTTADSAGVRSGAPQSQPGLLRMTRCDGI
jgi:hypothetical protein